MKRLVLLASGALLLAGTAGAADTLPKGNPAAGEKIFARCMACHAIGPGATARMGPPLNGVVGRPAGSVTGFNYSPAMRASHMVWTPPALSTFLTAPMKVVPGTRMVFAGLPNAQDRADVIAYLGQYQANGAKK